jgi:chemotaxis response regulator CheB
MPKEAIRRGAVDEVLPLDRLAWGVLRRVQSLAAASASDRRP